MKLLNKLSESKPIKFVKEVPEALFALVLIVLVLLCLYVFDKADFIQKEFPGLMLDIVVFGVLIVIYKNIWDRRQDRKNNIKRWQEEIDDYRGWEEKEAMVRIMGNIRRLNKIGATKVDLHKCYFKEADLTEFDLKGANFEDANLEGAILNNNRNLQITNFSKANLRRARLISANLQGAILRGADLQGADLSSANLEGVDISGYQTWWGSRKGIRSSLKEARLLGTILINADLSHTNLQESIVGNIDIRYGRRGVTLKTNFSGANLFDADLRGLSIIWTIDAEVITSEWPRYPGEVEAIVELLSKAKSLCSAQLDPEVETQLKNKYPHLFEKPKWQK
jgi:uncharacterized protein YjbI with pentapeptide repeats